MIKYSKYNHLTNQYEEDVVAVGTTLYVRTECERIMSDVWDYVTRAYYWAGDRVDNVYLTQDAEYTIDANFEEILPKVYNMYFQKFLNRERELVDQESEIVSVRGRIVDVVRGRNHRGQSGKVVVVKEMAYNAGYRTSIENKLGIALDDEMGTYVARNGKTYPTHKNMIWVWARNCEVKNPQPDYEKTVGNAKARAEHAMAEFKSLCDKSKKVTQ